MRKPFVTSTARAIMRLAFISGILVAGGAISPSLRHVVVAGQTQTTLNVVGFEIQPSDKGTMLDKAHRAFLADFQKAHPDIKLNSEQTSPNFDTQLTVNLASGTAPDVWYQDASTLAPLIHGHYLLDMRKCLSLAPHLSLTRFFPTVLAIHRQADGALYGLPDDFTPMVIYYNPQVFTRAHVTLPTATWTWSDLLTDAQLLTLDSKGRTARDPHFDAQHVVQYGFRVRKYTLEWIYRVWENGSDVLSPNGTTAKGYLDSPATIQTLQFLQDMVLKYHVSPPPSTLDRLTQSLAFDDRFLKGQFAMFDRGHWELVPLQHSTVFSASAVRVASQPAKKNADTVIYESGWEIPANIAPGKLKAACQLVDAATDRQYQDTNAITGNAIAANIASAQAQMKTSRFPALEQVFIHAVAHGRTPYGAKFWKWPPIETMLDSMMERILAGGNVKSVVVQTVPQIDNELARSR